MLFVYLPADLTNPRRTVVGMFNSLAYGARQERASIVRIIRLTPHWTPVALSCAFEWGSSGADRLCCGHPPTTGQTGRGLQPQTRPSCPSYRIATVKSETLSASCSAFRSGTANRWFKQKKYCQTGCLSLDKPAFARKKKEKNASGVPASAATVGPTGATRCSCGL